MGLFDFLWGGGKDRDKVEVVPDRIWLTSAAKFAGLAQEAKERASSGTVAILLVAHFPDVLARLEDVANQHSWNVPCIAVPASNLNQELAASLNVDETANLDVIVAERHPLPSVDDRLEAFAEELPCRCRFAHHVSLDDAVLKVFAGDWVKGVLTQMGMKEDEAIESNLVSRRIRMAQQRIEGLALEATAANSAEEWLEKNCPPI